MTRSLALAVAIGLPVILAALSPLLAWRSPIYIIAGFAGILALGLLLIQPLLASGLLPGVIGPRARKIHGLSGLLLLALVVLHVAALWQTSPPDVIDALLLRSPTPFSIWGVIAMIGVLATALLASVRRKLARHLWQTMHKALAVLIAATTIAHALLIEGTMEPVSKAVLCALVTLATLWAITRPHPWRMRKK